VVSVIGCKLCSRYGYNDTYKFQNLGHLHLREYATRLVLPNGGCVTNCKRIWPLHGHLARFTTIKLHRPLNL
jgi:hypothetical protein